MIYVEWLRARKRLIVFAAILAAFVGLSVLCVQFGYVHSVATAHGHSGYFSLSLGSNPTSADRSAAAAVREILQSSMVPLGPFLLGAAVIALIFTISLCTSLNGQREALHLSWTKPLSRTKLALEFFAVDLAAIAALYAFVMVLCVSAVGIFGGLGHLTAPGGAAIVPLAGVLLLYGLMQMSTAWMRGGCGGMVAALWVSFIALPSLAVTPIPQLDAIVRSLLPLDPLQYFAVHDDSGAYALGSHVGNSMQTWGLGDTYGVAAILGFALAVAACAIAVFNWNRVEV